MSVKEVKSFGVKSSSVKGLKGKFDNQDLINYINTTFTDRVVKFNEVIGRGVSSLASCKDTLYACLTQAQLVLEESLEGIVAYQNNDTTERLDAIVDILVTNTMLSKYLHKLNEYSNEDVLQASNNFNQDDLLILSSIENLARCATDLAQGVTLFLPKKVYIACELILENNDQKWTTDENTMLDWKEHLEDGTEIYTTEIDDVKYYSIKRLSDGKCMKPYNFKAVQLNLM